MYIFEKNSELVKNRRDIDESEVSERTEQTEIKELKKMANDNNRSKQKNPNNDQYYKDRGYKGKKDYAKKYGF